MMTHQPAYLGTAILTILNQSELHRQLHMHIGEPTGRLGAGSRDCAWGLLFAAQRAGFVDGRYPPKGELRLAAGQEMTQVELRMVPQAAVSGRVLDEDGDPVPDISVTAMASHYPHGRRELEPADSGITNDRGEFRLAKLAPGRYYLSAQPDMALPDPVPPPPPDGAMEKGYVVTYFPNIVDSAQASRIEVAAGADLPGFNIQVQKSRVVRVKGKATGPDGSPLKNGQIMLTPAGNHVGFMAMVHDPEGKFELANVQPGLYEVVTMQMQRSTPALTTQLLVVPARNIDNVKLGRSAAAIIHGRIVAAGDAPAGLDSVEVSLIGHTVHYEPVSAEAAKDGAFELTDVDAAPYDLSIENLPDGTYVKSVLFNGRERLGMELDCAESPAGSLTITLGTDGGAVQASVSIDDKPAADATVVLLPTNPERRFPDAVRTEVSDAAGQVTLNGVPPGDYLAFAWETVEDGAWYDPEFLKPMESKGVRVAVRPGESEKVQLSEIAALARQDKPRGNVR